MGKGCVHFCFFLLRDFVRFDASKLGGFVFGMRATGRARQCGQRAEHPAGSCYRSLGHLAAELIAFHGRTAEVCSTGEENRRVGEVTRKGHATGIALGNLLELAEIQGAAWLAAQD